MFLASVAPFTARVVPAYAGMAGLHQTMRAMRDMVRAARVSPIIRQAAASVAYLTPEKNEAAEVSAIFQFVRDNVRYLKDVNDVETLSTPERTLANRYGDCDDQVTLLCSLLESVGYPTRFVVAAYQSPGEFEHVYAQVHVNDEWIDCDPTEYGSLGYAPPLPVTLYFERV
jgi:transglutaminase-like putative cysteine protease